MKKWHTVQDYLVIVFCACLLALSYHIFVFPNEFAPSGLPASRPSSSMCSILRSAI